MTMPATAPTRRISGLLACLLLCAASAAHSDETVDLVCRFQHGELAVQVNYTKSTANGATAIISDSEIMWTPKDSDGLAIINRYTGIMEISQGATAFLGMCNRKKSGK